MAQAVRTANGVRLTRRIRQVKPSFTLEMAGRAAAMAERGEDVINFSVGEPDFNTPVHIREAAKTAIDEGFTKYTAGAGTPELRKAICAKLKRENDLDYTPDQIVVSNGEKQSLFTACQVLFEEGDQGVVFTPYWVSFPEFVRLAEAEPLFVKTLPDRQFEPDFDDLKRIIAQASNIRGVILNSPSNPSGGVWSKEAVVQLLTLAAEHDWVVIADECYERLVYDHNFTNVQSLNTMGATVLTCMSMSKTYAMTGWRIGYAAGDKWIIQAMAKHQGQATSCANSIGQKAAVAALEGDQTPVEDMRKAFQERREVMVELLNDIPDVTCPVPGGAFYAFPDMSAYLGKRRENGQIIEDSFALSEYILDSKKVVTVPGDGFGAPGHIRFSFATNIDKIKLGMQRVRDALLKLHD